MPGVSFYTTTDQPAVRDELLRNLDLLKSPEYATTYAAILENGNLEATFVPTLEAEVTRLADAMDDRDTHGLDEPVEAAKIRERLSAIGKWFEEGELAVGIALKRKVPGARDVQAQLRRPAGTQLTFRDLFGTLRRALKDLAREPDLSRYGLLPDYLDRGRALLSGVLDERGNMHADQGGIRLHAIIVEEAPEDCGALMEEFEMCFNLAQLRLGRELAGLDMRYIRAARASRAVPDQAPAPAPTPGSNEPGDSGL